MNFESPPWSVVCLPHDGGRISRLRHRGRSILTEPSASFISPGGDWGRYETRPVYGYDDCFPTVDSCVYPDGTEIPDHGEVCWLPWQMRSSSNGLEGDVQCRLLPITFSRQMHFQDSVIDWRFEVNNQSTRDLPFLHIMHALLPVKDITGLHLPSYTTLYDEISHQSLPLRPAEELGGVLLAAGQGDVHMLLLQNIQTGRLALEFNHRFRLTIRFDHRLFPTLGIWWNNGGYPAANACRRFECAFEPIPGTSSSLTQALAQGTTLMVPAQCKRSWTVNWEITSLEL